jgi:hypothetical protein
MFWIGFLTGVGTGLLFAVVATFSLFAGTR